MHRHCGISYYPCICLEVKLTTDAEYAISTCEGVADARGKIVVAVVIVVVRLEISCRDDDVIADLIAETETDAIAIDNERHVVHVFVGDSVACELSTARHVQLVVHIPFYTGRHPYRNSGAIRGLG